MNIYERIVKKQAPISVIGLGYVGLPIAVAFAKKVNVIGFDINKEKVELYKSGIDPTKEVGDAEVKKSSIEFTADESKLKESAFHIVAVPTPIKEDKTPQLQPLTSAAEIVGRNLQKGAIVVFESTVFPGVTEEICIPILEKISGLKCGVDFKVGYSPERINPGDKIHRLENIVKVVSAIDKESLEIIENVYSIVVDAGIYKAESIMIAEAAKVIENAQRDINIAFMNELAIIFNKIGIDTKAVLRAAATKWNFIHFSPGLVGGHCIGVDPYYLTYKAEQIGYNSQIILAGRKINDGMGKYVAERIVKTMIKAGIEVKGAKVAIFGITFKENTPDVRNTKVIDIIKELYDYGIESLVVDPVADEEEVLKQYGIMLCDKNAVKNIDVAVFAVAHDEFKALMLEDLKKMYVNSTDGKQKVLVDIKGLYEKTEVEKAGYLYWSL